MDRTLIQEILEVVEQAGIASAKLTGMGLKNEADAAAVEAMRERMYKIQMQGRIVIGEGERDEAPMLYIGEEVGSGTGPGVDFAVDPCEGTNLCANSQRGSMAVLAASDRGGLFNAPDFYMKKLAAPPAAKGKVDINKSATENIKILSECLGLPAEELVIMVMDRARHKDLIKEIERSTGEGLHICDAIIAASFDHIYPFTLWPDNCRTASPCGGATGMVATTNGPAFGNPPFRMEIIVYAARLQQRVLLTCPAHSAIGVSRQVEQDVARPQ